MSRSFVRSNSSIRSIQSLPSGCVLAPPRTPPGWCKNHTFCRRVYLQFNLIYYLVLRRHLHASVRSTPSTPRCASIIEGSLYHITRHNHTSAQNDLPLEANDTPPHIAESSKSDIPQPLAFTSNAKGSENADDQEDEVLDSRFVRHLNEQFLPLEFPPELARRILTHASHRRAGIDGHNARLAFVGTCNLH